MERVLLAASQQGEPGPLCGPGVSIRARLREAGTGSAGERGNQGAEAGWGWELGDPGRMGLRPCCPQAVKALQTATKEAIALLQAMVEEVRHSAAEEEAAIHALFGSMQVRGGASNFPSTFPECTV